MNTHPPAHNPPASLHIRPIAAAELDRWHRLQHDAIDDPFTKSSLQQELSNPLARHHGIYVQGQLVAAFLAWLVVDELQIMQVVVDPNSRGRGLGTFLVRHAVARARAAGAVTATLEVRRSNVAARALYARCGFLVDGCRPSYYPDGEDAILMRRHLVVAGSDDE